VLPTIVNSGGNTDFCSLQKTVLMKYLIKTIEVMMLGGSEIRWSDFFVKNDKSAR